MSRPSPRVLAIPLLRGERRVDAQFEPDRRARVMMVARNGPWPLLQ
jgi:hypothetical protein